MELILSNAAGLSTAKDIFLKRNTACFINLKQ